MSDLNVTKVIYRYWEGDAIAIFPEIPANSSPYYCLSYQVVGQHGACDPYHIINSSKPATADQYASLHNELSQLYDGLTVVKRHTAKYAQIRAEIINSD